jgi:hypothetical protein
VIEDPKPDSTDADAWRTHRLCLLDLPADASHLMVLQDDVLPRPDFTARVVDALEQHPETVLLPFVPGFRHLIKAMREAHGRGETLMPFAPRAFVPTVAIIYPRAVVSDLLGWSGNQIGADDGIVAWYCRKRKMMPLAFVPCAADHDASLMSVGKRYARAGTHRHAALL